MTDDNLILVGLAHGPHGVRGLLKVESLSDNPARFTTGALLYACLPQAEPRPLTVLAASPHKDRLLLSLQGVESREQAAALLGAELWAEAGTPNLPAGQFYHYQLLGLAVYQRGEYLGEISEILSRPANDIYVVQGPQGEEIWLPALKAVVKLIDVENRRLEVELPEGL